ncbi:MAG TPA: hypothetical protein VK487_00760 [Candidatus Bathyarchaeia archaeon]|nr:hypothetical protein [Candidatus Bathyarchaeia archaeon]
MSASCITAWFQECSWAIVWLSSSGGNIRSPNSIRPSPSGIELNFPPEEPPQLVERKQFMGLQVYNFDKICAGQNRFEKGKGGA